MSNQESSWRGVVDLPETDPLLKNIPEAVPTLNSNAVMCKQVRRNTISCYEQVEKTKTTNKYKTHNRGKEAIYIYIKLSLSNSLLGHGFQN